MTNRPCLRVGVGRPVGSGKTALLRHLCMRLRKHYNMAVVTNDIYTREDAEFLLRHLVFFFVPIAVGLMRVRRIMLERERHTEWVKNELAGEA